MAREPIQIAAVRDVADFHLRWPDFRSLAAHAAENPVLSTDERCVLDWLIALADRIGEGDLQKNASFNSIIE